MGRVASGQSGEQRLDRRARIGHDRQVRPWPPRDLRGVDLHADEARQLRRAPVRVHVEVGRPELGPERQHRVGLGHQRADGR
jgi:hypothetical protein